LFHFTRHGKASTQDMCTAEFETVGTVLLVVCLEGRWMFLRGKLMIMAGTLSGLIVVIPAIDNKKFNKIIGTQNKYMYSIIKER